jgi:hypothetical protein
MNDMAQGLLSFQYEDDASSAGLTSMAGLPLYLELMAAAKLGEVIRRHLKMRLKQGWSDVQHIISLILLNLAGGDCLDDLKVLEADRGFGEILRAVEVQGLRYRARRGVEKRWRKERKRVVPSPSAARRYLEAFHDAEQEKLREPHTAFVPQPNQELQGLLEVSKELVSFGQRLAPQAIATLDMDATLIESHKEQAFYCYKGYQPLNVYWHEHGLMLYSEFRDGHCPAGWRNLEVFKEALEGVPAGVKQLRLRSDTAGYEVELLRYCAEGKNERFSVIDFAIAMDVTEAFKAVAAEEENWQVLYRVDEKGARHATQQQWAEVCFVPNWLAQRKHGPDYRFLAIREPLEANCGNKLPFATFHEGRYKLFGLISNRWDLPGDELIRWHRQRCGDSEQAHAVLKDDLAGGQLPSQYFGANAAWWQIVLLAYNLHVLMQRQLLGGSWAAKRLKAVRFAIINLAGRVVYHARRLSIRLPAAHPSLALLQRVRVKLAQIATGPPHLLAFNLAFN